MHHPETLTNENEHRLHIFELKIVHRIHVRRESLAFPCPVRTDIVGHGRSRRATVWQRIEAERLSEGQYHAESSYYWQWKRHMGTRFGSSCISEFGR